MSLSPEQQIQLQSNAIYGDMPQEQVDKIQAAAEAQAEYFEKATPTTHELGRLAANDHAAKQLAIQQVALNPNVDQDRVDAMSRQ